MARVFKRYWTGPDGKIKWKWAVDYFDQLGKRRYKTCVSKKEADAYAVRVGSEIAQGTHVARSATVTFGEAADRWVRDSERRWKNGELAGYTFDNYRRYVANYLGCFSRVRLTDLSRQALQEHVDECTTKYATATVIALAVAIRQILKFAVNSGWLIADPLASKPLRLPKKRRSPVNPPSADEVRALLNVLAERRKLEHEDSWRMRIAFLTLAAFTGMRKGEIGGLLWKNVDLANGELHIRHSLSLIDGLKGPKSRAGNRTIPIPVGHPVHTVLSYLRTKRGQNTAGSVFPRCPRARDLKPIFDAAGFKNRRDRKQTLHALRHFFVSQLVADGTTLLHIKDLAGHESVATTLDIYGHFLPGDAGRRKAIAGLSSHFDFSKSAPMLQQLPEVPGSTVQQESDTGT